MLKNFRRFQFLIILAIVAQLISPTIGYASPSLQGITASEQAQNLLDNLIPEERVGQLFIIEFNGTVVDEESEIYRLITEGHIGGVILKRDNDNFTDTTNMLLATWTLNQNLQQADWNFSRQSIVDPETNENFRPYFIPLFIGIKQDGNSYPSDQIFSGLTRVPSQMAIGATWNPENAFDVGRIVGSELSKLGFNMYLGPSLDILETPRSDSAGDLGISSFGGSPYWVSLMAQSYVSGLHAGSGDNLLVIGKHFPGYGGSDRPREEDIPVNQKSLEQLQSIDLVPYYSVTGSASSNDTALDGVLLAHAKYQGFQGNISSSTRPISLDPQAFTELFNLPEFLTWREDGGLVISDELGTQAVRRFYDPTEEQFNAPLVALNAFNTGNDLLYLGDFSRNDTTGESSLTLEILNFFAQKYREDPVFAQRVDAAVLRILTTKFELHPQFTLTNIVPPIDDLILIGDDSVISFNIASQAATLISPSPENLNISLPNPPGLADRIVIITDTYQVRQCSECEDEYIIEIDGFRDVANRLYGSEGAGQILRQNLFSFTFEDLETALNAPPDDFSQLLDSIERADWIIFIMVDINEERPTSQSLRRFLAERPDLIQSKNTVVFATDAPYFLDGTDISKLTAYYALYSKQPQFIEIAARLLFKEITAPGASPVSISGIEYDLEQAISPDIGQAFEVNIFLTGSNQENGDEDGGENGEEDTPEPTVEPAPIEFVTGDSITMETSIILDFNKNPVPNGTLVRFSLRTTTTDSTISQREVTGTTINGIVKVSTILETPGILEIQASSGEPPLLSAISQFDIGSSIPDEVPTLVVTEDVQLEETPVGEDGVEEPIRSNQTTMEDWLLVLLTTGFLSLVAYQSGANTGQVRWGMRWALTSLIGGMVVNIYLSFDLPGSEALLLEYEVWGIVVLTAIGAATGWFAGWIWQQRGK